MTTIRLATEADAHALQAIYAPYVQNTTVSFELTVPTVEEMAERIRKTLIMSPWLVCADEHDRVLGYAYASKHRERAAYQWSVDVSAYIDVPWKRTGMGRGLYTSLFALLRLQGYANAYAGIALPNEASIGLHTAMGFEAVGVYRGVGYKLGAWHDVSWWGLRLHYISDTPTVPRPLAEAAGLPGWPDALVSGLPLIRV
ncbi:MAG: N-acetyltransferase [Anaerolineae bacterium]|nr:N-acetyltransferase [Anaerolineae bacterium]